MEVVVNALVLRAVDYNENDKILTLLTHERGKISAGMKGVKKPNAKLRFAAQPFCFAEYVLSERAGRFTVINASENESFYDLRSDVTKFYAAATVTEVANALSFEESECRELFLESVKTLSRLCENGENESLLSFLLSVLKLSGYEINAEADTSQFEKLYFSMENGAFSDKGLGASPTTFNVIRKLQGKSYDPSLINEDGERRALKLINEYFLYKLNIHLKSLTEYINII